MSFDQFGFSEEVLAGLRDMNFSEPTPIQAQSLPLSLSGKNLIASAQTGTGKTAAFVLPILEKFKKTPTKNIKALILTPTRELALQIDEQIWALGYHAGVSSATVYGGGDWGKQEKALRDGVHIVVATPGRLLDHIRTKDIDFSGVEFFVLDEADRMLDMGFIPAVKTIVSRLPETKQSFLFSATITPRVESLANEFMKNYERINIATRTVAKNVEQSYYEIHHRAKRFLLEYLLKEEKWDSTIVFTKTKRDTAFLARQLHKSGFDVAEIHGDRDQAEREEALHRFRQGKASILVATDVVARGIDIDNVSHVVNYDVPKDGDDYIHRIGRTARANTSGNAVTLCSPRNRRLMEELIKVVGSDLVQKPLPDAVQTNHSKENDQDRKGGGQPDNNRRSPRGRGRGRGRNSRGNAPHRNDHRNDTKSDDSPKASLERKQRSPRNEQQDASSNDTNSDIDKGKDNSNRPPRRSNSRRPNNRRPNDRRSNNPGHSSEKDQEQDRNRRNNDRSDASSKGSSSNGEKRSEARNTGDQKQNQRGKSRPDRFNRKAIDVSQEPPKKSVLQRIKGFFSPWGE